MGQSQILMDGGELVIVAVDSWRSLMEKRPLDRVLKPFSMKHNLLSSVCVLVWVTVSIFTLPQSPTCGQPSLNTSSTGHPMKVGSPSL